MDKRELFDGSVYSYLMVFTGAIDLRRAIIDKRDKALKEISQDIDKVTIHESLNNEHMPRAAYVEKWLKSLTKEEMHGLYNLDNIIKDFETVNFPHIKCNFSCDGSFPNNCIGILEVNIKQQENDYNLQIYPRDNNLIRVFTLWDKICSKTSCKGIYVKYVDLKPDSPVAHIFKDSVSTTCLPGEKGEVSFELDPVKGIKQLIEFQELYPGYLIKAKVYFEKGPTHVAPNELCYAENSVNYIHFKTDNRVQILEIGKAVDDVYFKQKEQEQEA